MFRVKIDIDWKTISGMVKHDLYKKKFAFFPRICQDGTRVWLKFYYKKYHAWSNPNTNDNKYDRIYEKESITEEEYIVRKLSENF